MKVQKGIINNHILSGIKNNKSLSQIAIDSHISKSHLSYYLSKLEQKGVIENKGYGKWTINNESSKSTKDTIDVRGHAFMWKIKIPRKYNLKNILIRKNIKHKLIYKGTPSILFKNRKIWLGNKNIIIYEIKSYFGANAVDVRKYAICELLEVLGALESKLGISLKRDDEYTITTARQHYALVKNNLAIQCNREGVKIDIRDKDGQWFIIDNSYNLDEAETVHPSTSLVDNIGVQRYFNEHKETKFQVTPKFLLKSISGLTNSQQLMINNLNDYGKHIKAHTESIMALSKAIPQLTKLLKDTKEENSRLKQRRLNEFGM